MNVTLKQIRAFIAIARTHSFTLAAESLYITQSALSGLIKEFEDTIKVRLVDRSTRNVYLTDVGERLYPVLDAVINDLNNALQRITDPTLMQTDIVRVAASQLLASTLMPDLIAQFQTKNPQSTVKLLDTTVESVIARVFSGEAELGIGPEREPNSDITATWLFDGPFMAVFPNGHPLGDVKQLSWKHLQQYQVVTLRGQFTERLIQDLHSNSVKCNFYPTNQVTYMSTALSMVKAGLGVGLCIPYVSSLVETYGLQMRQLSKPQIRRNFYVFTRRGRSLSPAAQNFLDFIQPKIQSTI